MTHARLALVFAMLLTIGPKAAACAEGVELQLSSAAPTQGSLVLVEVRPGTDAAQVEGHWRGRPLRFWRHGEAFRALAAVDLDQTPRRTPMTLTVTRADGVRVGCSELVDVRAGEFTVERLTVARQFVELSATDLARAEKEAERLRAIFADATRERLWQGKFLSPVEGVGATGNFGRRRWLNNQPRSPHSGEDFPAPAGTPVRASQRGRVALAEELFFSGNTVVVDHGLGLYTFYGHLESIAVRAGEAVEAGAVVGRVGATGRVTGAHLHWAARLNDARVNPLDLVGLPE
jgi:murein DD-endopeptidase MepM/ murein hydrolase activator NlpD